MVLHESGFVSMRCDCCCSSVVTRVNLMVVDNTKYSPPIRLPLELTRCTTSSSVVGCSSSSDIGRNHDQGVFAIANVLPLSNLTQLEFNNCGSNTSMIIAKVLLLSKVTDLGLKNRMQCVKHVVQHIQHLKRY